MLFGLKTTSSTGGRGRLDLRRSGCRRRASPAPPCPDQRLRRQVHEQDDEDEREKCAAEETAQAGMAPGMKGSSATLGRPARIRTPQPARSGRLATPRCRGDCDSARRSRGRTRSRSGWGSRSPRSGSRHRSRAAPASPAARRCPPTRDVVASRLRTRYESVSPESTMSSTTSTFRSSTGTSRSLRIRTTPDESTPDP